jgi:anti-sigma factor ChrR (cupin superfamily)
LTSIVEPCAQTEQVHAYALRALPQAEAAALEAHLGYCVRCREELQGLGSTVGSFTSWPTDILRPDAALQRRLAQRIAAEPGTRLVPPQAKPLEPDWEQVAPGISCKLLAEDTRSGMVSMLVRLAPGGEYPPHAHAGVEELHLLDGELWIDERKLRPGDYNRAEPGTSDKRVWSETGCTCVLVTSSKDALR